MSVEATTIQVGFDSTVIQVAGEATVVEVSTEGLVVVSAVGNVGGGTTDHAALSNRGLADQHPTSAITGLDAALAVLTATISTESTVRATADAAEVTARNAAISTAIANLIASAPGALDTLNELAVALGNDPNFATTITNLLAGKQPLDADLTAIANLVTQAFGRSLLTGADAAAVRSLLVLGSAALANTGDFDPAGAATAALASAKAYATAMAAAL